MKMPAIPPDLRLIQEKIAKDTSHFYAMLEVAFTPLANGKYLHWDELIHRQTPGGLTPQDWWWAIKRARFRLAKDIPLNDKQGKHFRYLQPDPIPERLHTIDLGAGGTIQMPGQITNPETRDRYYVGSLIEEAITSSQLEGAATTRLVAKKMIRDGRTPRDRSEQMILNNFLTMQRIGELKDKPLTRELVFEIHRLVTDKTLDDPSAAGRFRQPHEKINVRDDYGEVFHDPPAAEQLEERLAAMCDFANGTTPAGFIHPVIRSIMLHFWLAYDHPFVDGNGRTARALFYWSMLHHGFWLFEFISISRIILKAPAQYARAFLYTETDDNDLTYFLLYHIEVIHRAIGELHDYINRKTAELQAVEHELRGTAVLNLRQRALISHALRHPHFRYTIQSHKVSHQVVYQTARTDLLELEKRGLLQAQKIGKTIYFTPVERLGEKLATLR